MAKRIPLEKITLIKQLRSRGWSLPEIHKKVGFGYGTIFRHLKDVQILPKYRKTWLDKRGGSAKRKRRLEIEAYGKARDIVKHLNEKERLLHLAALYWGEGGKTDFNFTNSDPEMIRIFVSGLRNVLNIKQAEIRASIRIYEDINRQSALDHWSKVTNIPVNEFMNVDVLKGKKLGKLKYGLCRIRIKKGGNMLKYFLALNKRVAELFSKSPHSSTDRTEVS